MSTTAELWKNVLEARNNENTAGFRVRQAEKDHCLSMNEATFCDEEEIKKEEEIAKQNWKPINDETIDLIKRLKIKCDNLIKSVIWRENIKLSYETQKKNYKNVKRELEKLSDSKSIKDRLSNFYYKKTDGLNNILYILKILYWIFFIVMVTILIFKKQYKKPEYYPMLICILIFPILFMQTIKLQVPYIDKEFKVSGVFHYIFEKFQHFKIDNIFFIAFVIIIGQIFIFTKLSNYPFKNMVNNAKSVISSAKNVMNDARNSIAQ
jgi:hypothetical protein